MYVVTSFLQIRLKVSICGNKYANIYNEICIMTTSKMLSPC